MDRRVHFILSKLSAVAFAPSFNHLQNENGIKFSQKLLIEQLAQSVNLSTPRLSILFKIETGITLKQQLDLLRLERAKQLAETTFKTIDQILLEVGAVDPSHFRRKFKKVYGRTLSEYRNLEAQM